MLQPSSSLAYSLNQMETGWRWSVYDLDGVTVADGADISRDAALAAVQQSMRMTPPEARSISAG
jgi:hypothetical protein